jgi:hypothetical protein
MLHCVGNPHFSNFFLNENYAEWQQNEDYRQMVNLCCQDVHKVHIAHCTYLIKVDIIPKLSYIARQPGEWEFLTFSLSAREQGVYQYVDNTRFYGLFLHFWSTRQNEIHLFKVAQERIEEILDKMEKDDKSAVLDMLTIFKLVNPENIE